VFFSGYYLNIAILNFRVAAGQEMVRGKNFKVRES